MDPDNQNVQKRGRGEGAVETTRRNKKGKKAAAPDSVAENDISYHEDIFDVADAFRPPGLFDFPWQKEEDSAGRSTSAPEPDGWECEDLRYVFFSSLVDGCSASIGVPGDRLSPAGPHQFCLLEEPGDGELDGGSANMDCDWSSILRQPISAVYSKSSNA